MEFEALPIALTQDRAQIHKAYATPGGTSESLPFEPLYIMGNVIYHVPELTRTDNEKLSSFWLYRQTHFTILQIK